jgi:hypothetical protein
LRLEKCEPPVKRNIAASPTRVAFFHDRNVRASSVETIWTISGAMSPPDCV